MGLPHYLVEKPLMNAADATGNSRHCPVCGKTGRWDGDTFQPANEKQAGFPRCYCLTIHKAGAWAYDPETKQLIYRESPK